MTEQKNEAIVPPGIMIYRSSRPLLELLAPQDFKRVLLAMLDYKGPGTEPDFDDPALVVAWTAMRERLELDRRRYTATCMSNRYKRFLREAQRMMPREECPDFKMWFDLSDEGTLSAAQTLLNYEELYPG